MTAEIISTKDTFGDKYRVRETCVRVLDIVESYQELGWAVEEIAKEFGLNPQEILEALKFFYENNYIIVKFMDKGDQVNT